MDNIHTIILAAGASSRFGDIKALAPWGDGTLLSHAIATAQTLSPHVFVVTGAHREALLPHLTVPYIYNEGWESGMGGSVACGLAALPQTAELALILPVDQPLVTAAHLKALIDAARKGGKAVFTQQDDIIGPPIALPARLFAAAKGLNGETGLKHVLHADDFIAVRNHRALLDIDTPADLQRLRAL